MNPEILKKTIMENKESSRREVLIEKRSMLLLPCGHETIYGQIYCTIYSRQQQHRLGS